METGARVGWPDFWRLSSASMKLERLIEVSFAVQQRHRNHPHLEVGGGAHGVTREHPWSAAVGRHRRLQGDFHREIGNYFQLSVRKIFIGGVATPNSTAHRSTLRCDPARFLRATANGRGRQV